MDNLSAALNDASAFSFTNRNALPTSTPAHSESLPPTPFRAVPPPPSAAAMHQQMTTLAALLSLQQSQQQLPTPAMFENALHHLSQQQHHHNPIPPLPPPPSHTNIPPLLHHFLSQLSTTPAHNKFQRHCSTEPSIAHARAPNPFDFLTMDLMQRVAQYSLYKASLTHQHSAASPPLVPNKSIPELPQSAYQQLKNSFSYTNSSYFPGVFPFLSPTSKTSGPAATPLISPISLGNHSTNTAASTNAIFSPTGSCRSTNSSSGQTKRSFNESSTFNSPTEINDLASPPQKSIKIEHLTSPSSSIVEANEHQQCQHCGKQFISLISLTKHRCHALLPPQMLKSTLPDSNMGIDLTNSNSSARQNNSSLLNFSSHAAAEASTGPSSNTKAYACQHCDKAYFSLSALKMHIRTHTLPCRCQLCGKAFSRMWLLQGHLRTHTGERPFQCEQCGRAFADRSNLRAHMQTHSAEKKYKCLGCPKSFSRMGLLVKHRANGCHGINGITSSTAGMLLGNHQGGRRGNKSSNSVLSGSCVANNKALSSMASAQRQDKLKDVSEHLNLIQRCAESHHVARTSEVSESE